MRFWDTSALVPLLAEEPATASVQRLYPEQPAVNRRVVGSSPT